MPSTAEVIVLTRRLRALAATLAADARDAEKRGELTPAAVDEIMDRVFQPLLDQVARLLQAQDSVLLGRALGQLQDFDDALEEFEDELEEVGVAPTLLSAGVGLVASASKIVEFVVNPTPELAAAAAKSIAAAVEALGQ